MLHLHLAMARRIKIGSLEGYYPTTMHPMDNGDNSHDHVTMTNKILIIIRPFFCLAGQQRQDENNTPINVITVS